MSLGKRRTLENSCWGRAAPSDSTQVPSGDGECSRQHIFHSRSLASFVLYFPRPARQQSPSPRTGQRFCQLCQAEPRRALVFGGCSGGACGQSS